MEEWIIGSLNCWIDDPLAGPLFAEAIKAGPGGDAVGDHELIADQIGRPDELSPKAGGVGVVSRTNLWAFVGQERIRSLPLRVMHNAGGPGGVTLAQVGPMRSSSAMTVSG